MSDAIIITADLSALDAALSALTGTDLSEITREIEKEYMGPLMERTWAASGLHSRSGQLKGAVHTFAGRVSVGIGIQKPSRRSLVMAKAYTHTQGRKKHQYQQLLTKRDREHGEVRRKLGLGVKTKRRSPWGDIPARKFIPDNISAADVSAIRGKMVEFINDRLAGLR